MFPEWRIILCTGPKQTVFRGAWNKKFKISHQCLNEISICLIFFLEGGWGGVEQINRKIRPLNQSFTLVQSNLTQTAIWYYVSLTISPKMNNIEKTCTWYEWFKKKAISELSQKISGNIFIIVLYTSNILQTIFKWLQNAILFSILVACSGSEVNLSKVKVT